MTFEPEPQPVSAPKWARMPGSVRLKLDHTIADHLRAHGARHYDLLRNDPAFAPWIGTHLGERGKKRLDRAIRDVRRFQKQKMHGRSAPPTAWAADDASNTAARDPLDDLAVEPTQRFAAVGAAVISYDELQEELRRRRWQLERAMGRCLDEDGDPVKPDLYLKLSREHRALINDSANLAKRYHADLNSKAVMERVVSRLLEERADDPQSAHAIIDHISNVFRETTGIAATGESA